MIIWKKKVYLAIVP